MYLDGMRKEIITWVQQGLNDQEIADRCRVSRSTVRYWRERNGVLRPAKAKDSPGAQNDSADTPPSSKDERI
jgi:transposase